MKIQDIESLVEERRFKWYKYGAKPLYYWSYGMLCDPDNMEYEGVTMIGRARLDGYKLELLGHANVVKDGGSAIWGTLWKIDTQVLDQLDMVEGYPHYYTRVTETVTTDDGRQYRTQIYVMTDDSRQDSLSRSPAEQYVGLIRRGYQHAGIPQEQLWDAIDDCVERVNTLRGK
jgi:gamma-glutamylcyclotransferase (GGCT)/AIG2-like uncharacterized protein YtfP